MADKENHDFLLVQHARQWWKTAPNGLNKGNDRLLRGLAMIKDTFKFKCYFLDYGADVNESKTLIEELGLISNVEWIPNSKRKDLMGLISACDIAVGETGDESWFMYCASAEILAAETAFLGYRKDKSYQEKNLFGMLNANTSEGIAKEVNNFMGSKENWNTITLENKSWLLNYNSKEPLEVLTKMIGQNRKVEALPFISKGRITWSNIQMRFFRILNRIGIKCRIKYFLSPVNNSVE